MKNLWTMTATRFWALGAALLTLVFIALSVAGAVKADPLDQCPSPQCESAFLEVLQNKGLNPDPSTAIENAEKICVAVGQGATFFDMVNEVLAASDFTPGEAGYYTGAAIAAFCPQYVDIVPTPDSAPAPADGKFKQRLI